MHIQITNISMRYSEGEVSGVHVYFNGQNSENTINISGYVPLTHSEYTGNESITALTNLVRQKVSERLLESPTA